MEIENNSTLFFILYLSFMPCLYIFKKSRFSPEVTLDQCINGLFSIIEYLLVLSSFE